MSDRNYRGILCIGDPHLCTWAPGYRKDDYPQIILEKLQWTLEHARQNQLLPVLLGDLFHVPRDNANWLIARLMVLLEGEILSVVGNHDLSENLLCDHDSLKILLAAGRLRLLDGNPWIGFLNNVPVAIGGTNNRQTLPAAVDRGSLGNPRFVFWISHDDIRFPQYAAGFLDCREIPGVDLVINGHIHREMPDVVNGQTTWCNPGNIARVNRGDATRSHLPGVLQIDVNANGWSKTRIEVPHRPFENAFHTVEPLESAKIGSSQFITGLAAMQKFRTPDGEGLRRLIESNLPAIGDDRVRSEIENLMNEVLSNG